MYCKGPTVIGFKLLWCPSFFIVGRISAQFCNNCAVSEESTVCVYFDTSINIRHGGICEIKVPMS